MKKLFLTLAVAAASLTASAQVYVGGEVGLWRNKDANHTNFTIKPYLGYKLSDKWDLGIGIGYEHDYENHVKKSSFDVDPYARWSYVKFGPVSLFLDMGFGVATYKEKVDALLLGQGIEVKNKIGYDHVYVANMARADFYKSSIKDEEQLAQFIKDMVDDADQKDGFIFNRFYADCCHNGVPIPWEDVL